MSEPIRTVTVADRPSAEPGSSTATGGGATAVEPVRLTAPPGYELGEEIGHGGMGVVYRARDLELNREVAVKILLPKYAPGSPTARRFTDEAQITSQLQHPGVPPVYRVGQLPDGRPFLAMKLIKGDTLDVLLKGRPAGSAPWLGVFEGVCQAVGYAHAHGVIHRDLKPANVMVGSFGEVQVMDWGLAKILASRERERPEGEADSEATADPDPTAIRSLRDADLLTQYGSMLGTPAYMAPEQAIGAVDQIDRRTDVFGLGAILCSLLTGKPPFVGDSAESTRQLAARAKLDDAVARLAVCGAEPDLIALCRRCLSAEQADRPADGTAVAGAVATLRAAADERARRAEIDREKAEVETREQRKRRRVVQWAGGVVTAVLVLGIAGTLVGLVQAREAKEAEKRRADAEAVAKDEAVAAKKRAVEFRDQALDALRAATSTDVEKLIGERKQLTANERAYLEAVVKRWQKFAAQDGADEQSRTVRAEGHFRVALLWDRLGRRDEARAEYERTRDLQAGLATDFPDAADYRKDLARTHGNLGALHHSLGQRPAAEAEYQKAHDLYRQLADRHPDAPAYQTGLANAELNRGRLLVDQNKKDLAKAEFEQARDRMKRLADRFPDVPEYAVSLAKCHNNVGLVLRDLNRLAESRVELELGCDRMAGVVDRHPDVPEYLHGLAEAHTTLGGTLYMTDRKAEAGTQFERVCDLRKRLADQFPGVPEYQLDLGGSYNNLGVVIRDAGRAADSLPWLDKAVAVLRPLYQSEPRDVTARRYLKNTHLSRANALDQLRRYREAVADWDQVVELCPKAELQGHRLLRAISRAHAGQAAEAAADAAELWKVKGWDGGSWYDFARVYALCSTKLPDQKAEYADRAVEAVRKAIAAGFRDVNSLKTVPDLKAIRGREDFKKLVADLEK